MQEEEKGKKKDAKKKDKKEKKKDEKKGKKGKGKKDVRSCFTYFTFSLLLQTIIISLLTVLSC